MEYGRFLVQAFERESGKWRARIRRSDGKPVQVLGVRRLREFITGSDAKTAATALLMAISTIDAGSFSRHRQRPSGQSRYRQRGTAAVPRSSRPAHRATRRRRAARRVTQSS